MWLAAEVATDILWVHGQHVVRFGCGKASIAIANDLYFSVALDFDFNLNLRIC